MVSVFTTTTTEGGVECVGFSNDENHHNNNRWIATGGTDKNLKIWDYGSGICRCVCIHHDSVVSLQWHPSLPVVATVLRYYLFCLFNVENSIYSILFYPKYSS